MTPSRVLLIKGQSRYDVLRDFTDAVAAAFRARGIEPVVLDSAPLKTHDEIFAALKAVGSRGSGLQLLHLRPLCGPAAAHRERDHRRAGGRPVCRLSAVAARSAREYRQRGRDPDGRSQPCGRDPETVRAQPLRPCGIQPPCGNRRTLRLARVGGRVREPSGRSPSFSAAPIIARSIRPGRIFPPTSSAPLPRLRTMRPLKNSCRRWTHWMPP